MLEEERDKWDGSFGDGLIVWVGRECFFKDVN